VGLEYWVWLCDLRVFVDQTAEDLAVFNTSRRQLGHGDTGSGGVPLEYWVTWSDLRLCSVAIFADQARDEAFSADTAQDDGFGWLPDRLRFDVRRALLPGLVRPVAVVVDQVLAEQHGKVAFAQDQHPVQELAAQGSDDPLADGVPPRRPRQGGDRLQSIGFEHSANAVVNSRSRW
jgi:hypothetical protein